MTARAFDPLKLDPERFAREGGVLSGRWPLQAFERVRSALHAEAAPGDGDAVVWHARGEWREGRGVAARPWLHLKAGACLQLQCQRCLRPVESTIEIDRWFTFIAGEEAAAELDADSEDDVLALTRALDLAELVEDELLLALPLVPRHDVCPEPLVAPSGTVAAAGAGGGGPPDDEEAPHPFAALAALKRRGPLN